MTMTKLNIALLCINFYLIFQYFIIGWLRGRMKMLKTYSTLSEKDKVRFAGPTSIGVVVAFIFMVGILTLGIMTLGYMLLYVPHLRLAAVSVIILYVINYFIVVRSKKCMQPEFYKKFHRIQGYVVQAIYFLLFSYMIIYL